GSEELATTAAEMSSQANGLQRLVGFFKVAGAPQGDQFAPTKRQVAPAARPASRQPAKDADDKDFAHF
ncbi:MAG TPA: hypothetical protein VFW68_04055, partial [Rhodocyclaceae bacterium]|nr:hypothetical protein [Rhodocyclaceae bacterium]